MPAQSVLVLLFLPHKLDVCQWLRFLNSQSPASKLMTGAFLVLPSKKSTEKKLLGIHTWKIVLEECFESSLFLSMVKSSSACAGGRGGSPSVIIYIAFCLNINGRYHLEMDSGNIG